MSTPLYHTLVPTILVAITATLGLHLTARIFFLSSKQRSRNIFANTRWLPLRFSTEPLIGEEVEFQSRDHTTLRGVVLRHKSTEHKGSVLFCHELNGTRLSVSPYVNNLAEAGFDVFTFDFRNHGKSDFTFLGQPTPWVTSTDMEDVQAAIDFLVSRSNSAQPAADSEKIGIFGFGKGAAVALCAAGSDERVNSVVLDAPMAESALFDINCRELLSKAMRLSRRRSSRFLSFVGRAILYSLACPVISVVYAWRRFVIGMWFGCRFIDPRSYAKKVQQPVMVVHSNADASVRADQIQAFCHRMAQRPQLWFVSDKERVQGSGVPDSCARQVARFFTEAAAFSGR